MQQSQDRCALADACLQLPRPWGAADGASALSSAWSYLLQGEGARRLGELIVHRVSLFRVGSHQRASERHQRSRAAEKSWSDVQQARSPTGTSESRYRDRMTERGRRSPDSAVTSSPGEAQAVERVMSLCAGLDAEPLFHASLGSKELFHSNLIAWFVDHHPEAAREVFESWSRSEPGTPGARTDRERRHLDLVIRLQGLAPLVIENKVFSPPRDKQLEEYAEDIAPRFTPAPEFVLLSLSDPRWPSGQRELGGQLWSHLSYGDLGAALTATAHLIVDAYERATVERYATIAQTLQAIAEIVAVNVNDSTTFALPVEFKEALQDVRLTQGFEKLRTRSIAHFIEGRLAAHEVGSIEINDEYTRSWPLLDSFVRVPGTDDEIGWQYQEGQWRLAVRLLEGHACYGKGAPTRARREQYVAERYAGWFDFTQADAVLGTSERSAKDLEFKGFAPDFVYLYRRARDVTVGQLSDLAESTARRALTFRSEASVTPSYGAPRVYRAFRGG